MWTLQRILSRLFGKSELPAQSHTWAGGRYNVAAIWVPPGVGGRDACTNDTNKLKLLTEDNGGVGRVCEEWETCCKRIKTTKTEQCRRLIMTGSKKQEKVVLFIDSMAELRYRFLQASIQFLRLACTWHENAKHQYIWKSICYTWNKSRKYSNHSTFLVLR